MDTLWKQVQIGGNNECWPWLKRAWRGYGRVYIDGKHVRAHRLAYELCYGQIPAGSGVFHRCNNVACCNPAHLFLATRKPEKDQSNSSSFIVGVLHIADLTRIMRSVEFGASCWIWKGATSAGYGQVWYKGRNVLIHRLFYAWAVGPLPHGKPLQIDHLCRERRCCNPVHLELVTHAENARRSRRNCHLSLREVSREVGQPRPRGT